MRCPIGVPIALLIAGLMLSVDGQVPSADPDVVTKAAREVKAHFKEHGFEFEDALAASRAALRHVDLTPDQVGQLSGDKEKDVVRQLVQIASQMGKLNVKSEPEGATAQVNGVRWGKTPCSGWCIPDSTLALELRGYERDTSKPDVEPMKENSTKRTLKRKG